jgi:hypothetical protein
MPRNEYQHVAPNQIQPFEQQLAMVSNSAKESAEQEPAAYYRAASARARRVVTEVTTLKVKQYLRELIDRYDRIAEEIERSSGALM